MDAYGSWHLQIQLLDKRKVHHRELLGGNIPQRDAIPLWQVQSFNSSPAQFGLDLHLSSRPSTQQTSIWPWYKSPVSSSLGPWWAKAAGHLLSFAFSYDFCASRLRGAPQQGWAEWWRTGCWISLSAPLHDFGLQESAIYFSSKPCNDYTRMDGKEEVCIFHLWLSDGWLSSDPLELEKKNLTGFHLTTIDDVSKHTYIIYLSYHLEYHLDLSESLAFKQVAICHLASTSANYAKPPPFSAFAVKNRSICQRSKSRKTCWSCAVAVAPLMSLGSTGDSGDSTESFWEYAQDRPIPTWRYRNAETFWTLKNTGLMPTCQATKWMVDETSAATHGCSPQFPIRPTSRPRAPAMCSFDVCFFPAVRVKRCHPPGCQDLPPVKKTCLCRLQTKARASSSSTKNVKQNEQSSKKQNYRHHN